MVEAVMELGLVLQGQLQPVPGLLQKAIGALR
jgi:hypothetical protein